MEDFEIRLNTGSDRTRLAHLSTPSAVFYILPSASVCLSTKRFYNFSQFYVFVYLNSFEVKSFRNQKILVEDNSNDSTSPGQLYSTSIAL